jgi:hypothetical protein
MRFACGKEGLLCLHRFRIKLCTSLFIFCSSHELMLVASNMVYMLIHLNSLLKPWMKASFYRVQVKHGVGVEEIVNHVLQAWEIATGNKRR